MWVPIGARYGLSVEEFYRMNPRKLERYQPFLMARYKGSKDSESEVGWINGQYVARAIGTVMSKGKRYPEEPIQFYSNTDDDEAYEFTDADRFKAWADVFNQQFAEKHKETTPESHEHHQ